MRPYTKRMNRTVLVTMTVLILLLLSACDLLDPNEGDDQDGQGMSAQYFVISEGNYGQNNASLWSIDESLSESMGPLVWNTSDNPLGDVGQSMTLDGNVLYLVLNNSHEIKSLTLADSLQYSTTIDLPGASPRQILVQGSMDRAFISSWGLGAILILDLSSSTVSDTIRLNGLPGEMLISDDKLYVSMNADTDWQSMDQVLELNIGSAEATISRTFTVLPGPGSMALLNDKLYVTSLAYDPVSWAATTGTSRIDLSSGQVSWVDHGVYQNFTADIDILNGVPYRVYGRSIVPLGSELRLIDEQAIGNLSNIYSFSVQNGMAVIGTSDYVSPDSVHFYSGLGEIQASMPVAAFPGQVLYFDPSG
ncbi:MAG: hypothetical protein K9M49_10450 [Candidatus Marinimicrobia bacterium]|nr:hypothetical protein [Candidatus Neomarinimicrobiota bacterium]MCF7851521.1 hypothetical protein [Candidatus Neomarinimicrobiota bacterium]MCF7905556.1 hypothetical protein [Candidatus Neomarinimicrobiota bacterium]